MCYFHAIGTLSSVDKLCGGWMSLRETEAPKRPGETHARHVLFSSPSPSPHILRRRITASRAVWARSESGGAWDWVEGGSGGGGRSHGIGRVQRQTCWLITELLLSVHLDAELSGASGAETVKLSDAPPGLIAHSSDFRFKHFPKLRTFFLLFAWRLKASDLNLEEIFPQPRRSLQERTESVTSAAQTEDSPDCSHGFHGETRGGRAAEEPDRRPHGGEIRGRENRSLRAGNDSRGIWTISATVRGGKVSADWNMLCGIAMNRKLIYCCFPLRNMSKLWLMWFYG